MATFPPYEPLFGAGKTSRPRTKSFGTADGYQQRVSFGLNTDPKEWQLEFNLCTTEAAEVEAFLEARRGVEAFDWTPPDSTTSYKWICNEWNSRFADPGRVSISTTFLQVFEP